MKVVTATVLFTLLAATWALPRSQLKEILKEVEAEIEKKEHAQHAAREMSQYFLNDFAGVSKRQSDDPAWDGLSEEQKEYAESVMAEYFMESMADEFPAGTDDAKKRGISKPHVIFFLIDDLGTNDVPWTNPEVHAPYMMDLATNGVILDNYYAQPVCSPSRGAVMTGNYAFKNGMQHDVITYTAPECAPSDLKFISEKLKGAGYATHALGKWHLGFCNVKCTPTYRGFDTFYGFYQGYIDHYSHMVSTGYDWWDNVAGAGEKSRMDLQGKYAGDLLTDRAVELINKHDPSSPLYMYFSHSSVHTPIQAPDKYMTEYGKLDKHRGTYLGMVTGIDDSIKQVTEALKAKGMYENTVIMFTSDNGAEFFAGSNGKLRGSKTTFYEAGIKVPGFIHSPMISAKGTRSKELMHITDWHSTILAMAGVDNSGIDGVDQSELLVKGGTSARDEIVFQIDSTFPQRLGAEAIRVGNYKLLRGFPGLFDGYESEGTLGLSHKVNLILARHMPENGTALTRKTMEAIKRGGYSFDFASIDAYIKKVENVIQLYDVVADPEERNNLADSKPDMVKDMIAKLDAAKKEERMPDLASQIPNPKGDATNYGGIWTPGWC